MFRIEEVEEVGCCSDESCSGVKYDDTVFVIVDTVENKAVKIDDYGIHGCGLYQEGRYRGDVVSGSMDRHTVEEAMEKLITLFS